jgi:hypothetical protein
MGVFMGAINTTDKILHHIRVKLYPNNFDHDRADGAYFARTVNDSTLGVTEICASMKERGGFSGNLEEAADHVRQFLDEMIWLLCDGFAVNTGYFSIHPKIGGTFRSPKETHDPENNPSRIIGICPYTNCSLNRIEVRTQFVGSATVFLKNPRVITGNFVLEAANAQ